MISAARSGNLSGYLKSTTQVVASGLRSSGVSIKAEEKIVTSKLTPSTNFTLTKLLCNGNMRAASGPAGIFLFFVIYYSNYVA